jgi:hypothetical protein
LRDAAQAEDAYRDSIRIAREQARAPSSCKPPYIIQAARVRKTREGEPCGFHEAQFFLIDFDPLGERVEVIAAVAAAMVPMRLHAPEM